MPTPLDQSTLTSNPTALPTAIGNGPVNGPSPQFYKPTAPTAGYSPDTVFNAAGQALDYTNYIKQGGLANFSNVVSGNVPKTVSPVISADKAATDLAGKQANFNQIQQGVATQQALNTTNQATAAQNAAAAAPNQTLNDIKGLLEEDKPQNPQQKSLEQVNQQADQAYEQYKADVDSIRNGTFPLSPDEQAQLDYVKKQFDQLKEQQITANKNYEGGVTTLGIVSGRQRYAPEIDIGNIKAAVDQGIKKVSDIEAQAANTLSTLRQAFQDKDYQRINDSYKALTTYLGQKTDTINQIAQSVRDEASLALEQHKSAMADQQYEDKKQQDAIDFAVNNHITQPFYLVGNTAINSATGEKVDLATYQKLTGQKVGTPESETDFSHIQTDVQTPDDRKMAQDQAQFEANYGLNLQEFDLKKQQFLLDAQKEDARDTSWQDIGGTKVLVDNQTGEVISDPSTQPGMKKATSDLQIQALTTAQSLLDKLNDPLAASAIGTGGNIARFVTGLLGGTKVQDFEVDFNNLKSLLSLDNIKLLKGQGAVSDSERQLLADASSKLRLDMSPEAFKGALEDIATALKGQPDNIVDYIKENPGQADAAKKMHDDGLSDDDILQAFGVPGFSDVGSDTKSAATTKKTSASIGTGARTDRHDNPTAFTTDIAKLAGLKEGVDYVTGDPFSNGKYHTAKLLSDPIATTIKVIDKIGFKTPSGGNRWTYTDSIPQTKNWKNLSYAQKSDVIQQMYKHEGGTALANLFA